MISRTSLGRLALMLVALAGITACERDLTGLDPAPFPNDALVFGDAPGPGLDWFFVFDTSIQDPFPFQFDSETTFRGNGAVRIEVPGPGAFVGGVYIAQVPRDLTGYNALTFWAKASTNITMNEAGFGLDFEENAYRTGVVGGVPLGPAWRKVVIPIPDASKLSREKGMFWMAEGTETGQPYNIWVDEMKWERLTTFANYRPAIESRTTRVELGGTLQLPGGTLTVDANGTETTVSAAPAFFDFVSSDPSVVAITEDGAELVGSGTATITATLGGRAAAGEVVVTVVGPPEEPAPTPQQPADEVISLYSDAYDDVQVDTWSAAWDNADVEDVQIAGDNVKKYTNLTFAGVEFTSAPVDASEKGFIHLDVWAAQPSLQLKFVDFGPDGAFGGGDDSEAIIRFDGSSITPDAWSSLDIPFSALGGLAERAHLAQVVIEGTSPTFYLDNFYFYGEPEPTGPQEPQTAAPTPTQAPASVISMFSDAYDDVVVDTWSAPWDQATVADVSIAGTNMKRYTGLTFAGIEAVSQPIDASAMTHFRMDFWTPDPMGADAFFQVRLVDFGADGAFAGGDDTAANLVINATSTPAIASGQWVSIDVPLTAFQGMNRGAIAQMVLEGTPSTVFIDNVYFYDAATAFPTEPLTAAPTPSYVSENTISLFSDAYTDVTVDTWSTSWDAASVEDVTIAGNAAKKYTGATLIGIETGSAQIDASAMTHFRIDLWTAETITEASVFRIKLVSFGGDGAFGGGDDVEHELTFTPATTPGLRGGTWLTFDLPLSDFAGLTQRANMAQYILSGTLGEIWVDNVLFHN